jgi:curved DNA-binding protein CbpA
MRPLTVAYCRGQTESAPPTNLYELLGARPDDDAEGLKNAFRRAVKANHPDLYPADPDAPVRLSGIVRAYAILRDAQERASYDHALGFEREPLRPNPRRTFFDTMHNILSEVVAVVVLALALTGGYVLLADVLTESVEGVKVAEVTARGPAKTATVQPAAQPAARTGTTEREEPRDELAGVVVPNIAIVPSAVVSAEKSGDAPGIAKDGSAPGLTERDAGVAKAIEDSGAPIDQADAKTAVDQLKKSDAIEQPDQNQNMALSVGVEFSSLENDKSIPKSSSSDFTISDQKHHMKTPDTKTSDMKTPDMKTSDMKTSDTKTSDTKTSDTKTSGKPRAATIRQTPNHAPVKQASLENKNTSACSESQSCSSKVSPLLGVGF